MLGCAAVASAASDVPSVGLPEMAVVGRRGPERDDLIVQRVVPEYPLEMLRAGTSGKVRVELSIDRDGHVRGVWVLHSADPAFAAAVRRAIWKWRFAPDQVIAGRNEWRARMTVGFQFVDSA